MKKLLIILVVMFGVGYGLWRSSLGRPARIWVADWKNQQAVGSQQAAFAIAGPAINAVADRYGAKAVPTAALPSAKNLAMPFTSQAPTANWDAEHEEFCEEASILMVGRMFQGRNFTNTADAEAGLQQIKQWELDHLGFFESTTAAETKQVIEGIYGLQVDRLTDPTLEQIKSAVAAGHPVIVPAAGRQLHNPNFKRPGPIYHMLVIKGYTKKGQFITNDPGTRRGENYVYPEQTVMAAIHDWQGPPHGPDRGEANITNGPKVALVVRP